MEAVQLERRDRVDEALDVAGAKKCRATSSMTPRHSKRGCVTP